MDSDDDELLTLKERILLRQGPKIDKSEPTPSFNSVLKNAHAISDSEESAIDKDSDNDYELPPLESLSSVQKAHEILLLSESEDEVKEIHDKFEISTESGIHCSKVKDVTKKFNSWEDTEKISKKPKKSPHEGAKDSDKEIVKLQKQKLKEEKKREKELEKALKQSEKELQRSKKPDECLKAMRVVIDHNLMLESESQDIFCALDERNVKYSIEENPISFSIAWCKTVVDITVDNNQVLKEEREEYENNLVALIPNDMFIKMVYACMQSFKGKNTTETVLSDYIVNIISMFPQMKLTFIILSLDKYLRVIKVSEIHDAEFKKISKQVSKTAIEEAIVEVQLQTAVDFIFVNTMRELGDLLFRFTKAIAEAPQKKEKQMQKDLAFSWYADGDTSCPVKLGKDRASFVKLWQQQLQQFQNVSQEIAEAIAAMYSSPSSLIKAYKRCSSTNEAEKLLQDIVVRRNYGPLGTQRRIGPELSYKIYLFFTSYDENQILQR